MTRRCTYVSLPTGAPVSLVGWEVLLDNAPLVHHMILFGCGPKAVASGLYRPGLETTCFDMTGCVDVIAIWAAGRSSYALPPDAAFPLGAGSYPLAALQVHYNNPLQARLRRARAGRGV